MPSARFGAKHPCDDRITPRPPGGCGGARRAPPTDAQAAEHVRAAGVGARTRSLATGARSGSGRVDSVARYALSRRRARHLVRGVPVRTALGPWDRAARAPIWPARGVLRARHFDELRRRRGRVPRASAARARRGGRANAPAPPDVGPPPKPQSARQFVGVCHERDERCHVRAADGVPDRTARGRPVGAAAGVRADGSAR